VSPATLLKNLIRPLSIFTSFFFVIVRSSDPCVSIGTAIALYNCGLVVRVPGYRSRGPGSIPGATRFFLRSSGSGTGSTQPRDDN
jgi:hypothetical protein